jgi:type IV secretory pathway ATPase VirB11/archaellum biosynthesis ATPase
VTTKEVELVCGKRASGKSTLMFERIAGAPHDATIVVATQRMGEHWRRN